MQQLIYSVLIMLLACQTVTAQDSLALIFYWEIGDKITYQLEKTETSISETGERSVNENKRTFSITILEEDESSFLLQYYIDTVFMNGVAIAVADNRLLKNITGDIKYLVRVNKLDRSLGLDNWEEARDKLLKGVEMASIMEGGNGLDEKTQEIMAGLFDTEEKIKAIALKEFQILIAPLGFIYPLEDTIKYDDLLPIPFFSDPVPTKVVEVVNNLDTINFTVDYFLTSQVDEESSKRLMTEFINSIIDQAPKAEQDREEYNKIMKEANLEFNDQLKGKINYMNGWFENFVFNRNLIFNTPRQKMEKEEAYHFQLLAIEKK